MKTIEEQTTTEIDISELLPKVEEYRAGGYRLVQMGSTATGDAYEINYSFDKDYTFENLRITVQEGEEVPSITGIFWGAFIYENEIHDLFGINITGINVDYKGNFYKLAEPFVYRNKVKVEKVTRVKKGEESE